MLCSLAVFAHITLHLRAFCCNLLYIIRYIQRIGKCKFILQKSLSYNGIRKFMSSLTDLSATTLQSVYLSRHLERSEYFLMDSFLHTEINNLCHILCWYQEKTYQLPGSITVWDTWTTKIWHCCLYTCQDPATKPHAQKKIVPGSIAIMIPSPNTFFAHMYICSMYFRT